jgi:Zn finger protein HypA/HybF involved in hydrogenase expression
MLKGEKYYNCKGNRKFNYYLRQCKDCDELFEAETSKSNYCPVCKERRIKIRNMKSISSRRKIVSARLKIVHRIVIEGEEDE